MRTARMVCNEDDPETPVAFALEAVPQGNWRAFTSLRWTDAEGASHARSEYHDDVGVWLQWTGQVDRRAAVTAIEVMPGEVTDLALDVDLPSAVISGTIVDTGNGLPIGAQLEPGASWLGIVAFDRDGRIAGATGNSCDGTFRLWVPPGNYVVAVFDMESSPSYWRDAWAVSGETMWLSRDQIWNAGDTPISIEDMPAAGWIEVGDGEEVRLDISLDPGPDWSDLDWLGWYREPESAPPIPAEDPWRDPTWWRGRTLTSTWSTRAGVPYELSVDGEPIDLLVDRPLGPASTEHVVVAGPAGWVPEWADGYRIAFSLGLDRVVEDALFLDVGPGWTVLWGARAPHRPDEEFLLVGFRGTCRGGVVEADRAWVLWSGRFVETSPAGVAWIPDQ